MVSDFLRWGIFVTNKINAKNQGFNQDFEVLIAETAVWPNFFLINVFFALKDLNFLLLFLITAAGCCAVWRP